MKVNLRKLKKPVYIWSGIILFSFIFYMTGISHESLWCDEAFSAIMTEYSFVNIIKSAAADVHPPLYYMMIKIFRVFFGNSEWALRLLSVFSATGMVALGAGPVRRHFDERTAYFYALLTLFTPIILIMGHEVRMYSPAIFTVTACALYGISAIRENKKKYWAALGIFTIVSAYLHYYGLLAVAIINIILGIFILFKRREQLKRYFLSVVPAGLAYLPWALILINQARKVNREFWIPTVNRYAIIETLFQPFYYKEFYPIDPPKTLIFIFALLIPLFMTIIISFFILAKKKEYKRLSMSAFLFSIYVFTFAIALVLSFTLMPIFYRRYIIVCTAFLVLPFAIGINSFRHAAIRWGLILIYISINFVRIYNVYTKNFNGRFYDLRDKYTSMIKPGDLMITSDAFSTSTSIYYFPQADHFFHINQYEKQHEFIYDPLEAKFIAEKDIKKVLQKYKSFWYVRNSSPISTDPNTILRRNAGPGWECVEQPEYLSAPYAKLAFAMYKFTYSENNKSIKDANIKVQIKNIQKSKGNLIITLHKDKLGEISDAFKVKTIKAKGKDVTYTFENLPVANYAVIVVHDKNNDGELQINKNRIPEEGLGVFNYDPKLGVNLDFEVIKFPLFSKNMSIEVYMGYPPFDILKQ